MCYYVLAHVIYFSIIEGEKTQFIKVEEGDIVFDVKYRLLQPKSEQCIVKQLHSVLHNFLKIINYGQHIGKILNKSVNVVHFLFDSNIKNKNEFYEEQSDQEVENKKNKLKRFSRIHNDLFLDPLSDLEFIQKISNNN